MPVSTYVKNMEPSACLKILHLVALFFKEKKVLATQPPSCHPRRVFDCPESERKMRETGKERGELKASRHFINEQKRGPHTVLI